MIDLNNPRPNSQREFGEAQVYFLGYVKNLGGEVLPALFTAAQIEAALNRAANNSEDIPEPVLESWLQRAWRRFRLTIF